jgi:predicted FMN-binding regulatory protein PaiB
MIHYQEYQPTAGEILAFEQEQRAAKLLTVGETGWPCAGMYPFLRSRDWLEMHLVRTDEQVRHLEQRSMASVLIDEVLSSVPSHWLGPVATHADQLHRTVLYECEAEVIRDATETRRHLVDLLARYQPEGNFVPLDDPEYAAQLRAICLVRLRPVRVIAKFKLGQKLNAQDHGTLLTRLERRDRVEDRTTIAAINNFSGARADQ